MKWSSCVVSGWACDELGPSSTVDACLCTDPRAPTPGATAVGVPGPREADWVSVDDQSQEPPVKPRDREPRLESSIRLMSPCYQEHQFALLLLGHSSSPPLSLCFFTAFARGQSTPSYLQFKPCQSYFIEA